MKKNFTQWIVVSSLLLLFSIKTNAQTEQDALMMPHKSLCVAGMVGYNSWTNYWEGTFMRDNANIGRISTRSASVMLNYGITKNLNVLAGLPYISTKASHGTLTGLNGFQDLSIFLKWRAVNAHLGKQRFSLYAVGGYSTPSNHYNIELMPMAVGMGSNVLSGRVTADIQRNWFFATLSGAYFHRGNVEIDRTAYYTSRQINSDQVYMPDAGSFQFRTGYRTGRFIAQVFLDQMSTFGGFDIRKNDMPFVSNRMNGTHLGFEAKYVVKKVPGLEFNGNVWNTLAGRNMGKATGYMAGVAYIMDFTNKK